MQLQSVHNGHQRIINNQKGFTLIEIIAVLVILGILAVVAVPKYFDLQSQAQEKAMQAAMAEAIGRVNGKFAQALLSGSAWNEIVYDNTDTSIGTDLGDDFTISSVTYSTTDTDPWINIVVTGVAAAVSGQTISKRFDLPGAP